MELGSTGTCMRVISWDDFINQEPSPAHQDVSGNRIAATIGVFDGVHLGHQSLIHKIVSLKNKAVPTVITFSSNPKSVLFPGTFQGNLMSLKLKLEIFASLNVSQVVLIDFSGNFSKLGGREFIDLLRIRGNLRFLVIGSNFRCGYKLDTGVSLIKEINAVNGISTFVAESVTAGSGFVSSSRIRAAILSGDLVEARSLFGRNFKIDLSGMSKTPGNGGVIFNAAAFDQITPPNGRYPVLLNPVNSNEGIKTEVFIDDGNIIVPSKYHADSVEFIAD